MSATYLDVIVEFHRLRAHSDSRIWSDREIAINSRPSLTKTLRNARPSGLSVIAEVKRRSPSRGWIDEHLDPGSLARSYVTGGAAAISVLTDEPHFSGSSSDLRVVVGAVDVAVLRKDFIVSENDVLDSVEMGASALLLIVAALGIDELSRYLVLSRAHGIDALVEVHDEDELYRALDAGATLVGVNQRDLHSFEVDASRAERVVSKIPADVVAVAESGFRTVELVRRVADVGFDAVLIGEHLVTSDSREQFLQECVGAPIGARA